MIRILSITIVNMLQEIKDIIVYCTLWCGDCKTSKAILRQKNVAFVEKDIETNLEAKREFLELIGDGPHRIPRILFRQEDGSTHGMVTIDTLIEPAPEVLIMALQAHGYIPSDGK